MIISKSIDFIINYIIFIIVLDNIFGMPIKPKEEYKSCLTIVVEQ